MSVPSAIRSPDMVRGLQERAARALPADHVENADGWLLRHAPGCSWWVGTVLPHADAGPGALLRRVVAAEEFHAAHGTAPRFQISSGACPEDLDRVLAGRGYHRRCPMSLRVATTARVRQGEPKESLGVRLDDRPSRAWFALWRAVHDRYGDWSAQRAMLDRVDRPSAYASAMSGNDVVAVGRAVADDGWAGVFGMATLPEARGRGAARGVLAALAHWAGTHAADRMYLQVERDNPAALRLYRRAGFGEVCGYHYRTGS